MASHRALIVAASSADQLANLRDRPPLLIAADSGLHAVLDRGWTPDLVIGDLDSATAAAVETARSAGAAVDVEAATVSAMGGLLGDEANLRLRGEP